MKLVKYDPLIYCYTDLLDDEHVATINSAMKKETEWTIRFGEKDRNGEWLTKNGSSFVESLDLMPRDYWNLILDGVGLAVEDFCKDMGLEFDIDKMTGLRTVDKHHPPTQLQTHTDTLPEGCIEGYTVLIYLNDDYEGGELSFTIRDFPQDEVGPVSFEINNKRHPDSQGNASKINFWLKPKPFTVLIFPPRTPYFHTAHRITDGYKYLIKGFYIAKEVGV